MDVTWFSKEEIEGSIEEFLEKFDNEELDGVEDSEVFFKALIEAIWRSKNSDDEDEMIMYEDLEIDIEEYESLAYFIDIRGTDKKFVLKLTEDEQKVGMYSDEYEEFKDIKNNVWMDWTPDTQLQIMEGDPNTDAQFFSGDLKVKGSLKLASKPREWIYGFFDLIGREVD